MQRTLLGLALLVGLSFGFGCGGDDSTSSDTTATGGSDTTSTGGTISGSGGTTAMTGGTMATVMCGSETCTAMDPTGLGLIMPCCDTTTMTCGTTNPTAGGACTPNQPPYEGCPSVGIDQIAAPCCTDEANPSTGLCGFSVSFFGGGCQATTMAGQMVMGVTLPDPQYCDGTAADPADLVDASTDADAGM